ncbi:hypothetical protein [Ralstonia solanacearum species complex bacterium KE056]|uniref:hypothetical protein n=1 Tax=Ralstonia solanacearum species complex bacterium KE056 TaxID=3119585 RepID=UPI002FC370EB
MDLYRAVLAVSGERVVVLEWDGSRESRYESPLDKIQAVRIDQDLLPATLSFFLEDGRTVTLGYSSVSDKEIEQVVSFLRERMNPSVASHRQIPVNLSERSEINIGDSFYFFMSWKHVRRSPSIRILHWERPGVRLGGLKSSLGCLLLDDGSELVIIHRGRFVRGWLDAVYSSTELYIPWSAIRSVELVQRPNRRKSSVSTVKIVVQGHAIMLELFAPKIQQEHLVAEIGARACSQ